MHDGKGGRVVGILVVWRQSRKIHWWSKASEYDFLGGRVTTQFTREVTDELITTVFMSRGCVREHVRPSEMLYHLVYTTPNLVWYICISVVTNHSLYWPTHFLWPSIGHNIPWVPKLSGSWTKLKPLQSKTSVISHWAQIISALSGTSHYFFVENLPCNSPVQSLLEDPVSVRHVSCPQRSLSSTGYKDTDVTHKK